MILLVSNSGDFETAKIIEWLKFNKEEFIIEDKFEDVIDLINKNQFKSIFFRRLKFNYEYYLDDNIEELNNATLLLSEFNELLYYMEEHPKSRKIGNAKYFNSYKLKYYFEAKKIGIKVPESYIVNNKSALKKLYLKHSNLITKQASDFSQIKSKNKEVEILPYSKILNKRLINNLTETFFPSLVQEYINPSLEIKSLYFNEKIYSCAFISSTSMAYNDLKLLTQNKTAYDIIPFDLDLKTKTKINKLFKKMNLNFGVFDGIIDGNNEFNFLEINPNGKFAAIANTTKINIYKEISNYLCQ